MAFIVKQRGGADLLLAETPVPIPEKTRGDERFTKPKTTITKAQRATLRMKFGGRCAYCGLLLPEKGWHADHVEPVIRNIELVRTPPGSKFTHVAKTDGRVYHPERHSIDNMVPSCAPCNLFKASFSIEGFRSEIAEQVTRARAYSVNFRTAERFGLVEVVDKPVIFWFEQYQEIVQIAASELIGKVVK
ncbi:HNH endonuclease [Pectobacterium versatile]|uniref:HNH endonuclease n=1 Tax=Pectobacterium versatile TaxID=2488639 RepID=UPI001F3F87E1|nr:HNH endonuclease signature motif containing protein [Pectobacterium versatile]